MGKKASTNMQGRWIMTWLSSEARAQVLTDIDR